MSEVSIYHPDFMELGAEVSGAEAMALERNEPLETGQLQDEAGISPEQLMGITLIVAGAAIAHRGYQKTRESKQQ